MKAILSIVRKEFLQLRRDPRLFPVLFISPIIQLLLLGYAANLDVRDIPAVVCDLDRSAASRDFLDGFVNSGYFTVRARVGRMADIDRFLDNGQAAMALVVPRGFGDQLAAGRPASAMVVADGSESQSATIGVNYATMIAGRYAQRVMLEKLARVAGAGAKPVQVGAEVRVWYNPELRSRNFMIPGVLGLILMIMTMSVASMGIVREKEAGTMEQLIVTPVRPYELIIGKLLPFVLIGLFEAAFVLAVAKYWFVVPVRGSLLLLFGMCLAFMLNTLGFGLFISTISRTQQQAMFTTVFFIMPMMLLGGFVFPIENMPPFFQAVSHVVPTRYFFIAIRGIMLRGAGWPELWDQAASLLLLGAVVFALSILRFRKKLD
ncbi:MAG TPA: ABC transporter permease [Terriglobales bacterium]|nr:ABC transporter permease [Terriglobales bacterium]